MKKPRTIIVDDEVHVREFLKIILADDFDVIAEATNGREAIDFYTKEMPDLMLLDINMPFKRGDEVLDEIKNDNDSCIIVLASISDIESVKNCIELGATYFIRKDTPVPRMIEIIKKTWNTFEEEKKKAGSKYNLNKMLEEVEEDEKFFGVN